MNAPSHGVAVPDRETARTWRAWPTWTLSALVALMPLSFSIEPGIKALPVALLFFCSLALLRQVPVRQAYRVAAPVVAAAMLLVALDIANVLWHGLGWRPLDHAAHVLLYVVVAAVFGRHLRMGLVWAGFSLTAIGLGAVCLVQHYVLDVLRAHGLNGGDSAAIECATLLLGLALLALVQLLQARIGNWRWWLHGAGMVFGMYGALLTQSRGPLLAFVPAFLIVLLLHARRSGRWRLNLALGVAVCLGGAVATATLHGAMLNRFTTIQKEVNGFDQGDPDGSVGARLEMWRTALRAAGEHPLTGIGIDQYATYTRAEIAAGRSDPSIAPYNQPHNEYLRALATGGVLLLLALLAVFVLPLRYFARWLRDADDTLATTATAGLAIVVLYLFCAMGESVFYRVMSQSFFFFLVLGLALRVGYLARLRGDTPAPATRA
ncbi:O-antigen ligase family protein [Frateuria terrea]|uniref:O-antigen ligase n=1 Tax=Frateuria terrea TaxID=529704 RepID=A0A1H6SGH9_9GAMM|nr:O-antigen ligase family protein [Frateuria terrea]SEI67043.1 O-antigen ligase [Frateuria terrea]SFP26339.1 O-antigen ligase [Frateuria terrea]